MIKLKLVVENQSSPLRLDKYLALNTNYSRSKIETMLDEELISVDGTLEKATLSLSPFPGIF